MRKILLLFSLAFLILSCDKEDEVYKSPHQEKIEQNRSYSNYNITILYQQKKCDKVFYVNHDYNSQYDIINDSKELFLFKLWNDEKNKQAITINVLDLIDNYHSYGIYSKKQSSVTSDIFYDSNFRQFTISQYTVLDSTFQYGVMRYTKLRYDKTDTINSQNNVFIIKD